MRFISFVEDGEIINQIPMPANMTEENVMLIDKFMRENRFLLDDTQLCITENMLEEGSCYNKDDVRNADYYKRFELD